MPTGIKFCGLTRAEDARVAANLGAQYAGVIFAGGPRVVTEAEAMAIFAALPAAVKKVGVLAGHDAKTIGEIAGRLRLDVVQLHSDPTASDVRALRGHWNGAIWAVLRSGDMEDRSDLGELFSSADAVVVDAGARGTRGGTGHPFDWAKTAALLRETLRPLQNWSLVLAGGLNAANVATAIRTLRPGVVDVSSGVESQPGVKDHTKMLAFAQAVQSTLGD